MDRLAPTPSPLSPRKQRGPAALAATLLLVLSAMMSAGPANGYVTERASGCISPPFGTEICCNRTLSWNDDSVSFRRLRVSFPDGSTASNALIKGWSRWNDVADLNLSTVGSNGTSVTSNGINEIAYVPSEFTTPEFRDTPAFVITDWGIRECGYTEADMYWNPNLAFHFAEDGNHSPYGGNRNFVGVAVHEFGHTIGLQHEDRYYNVMGEDFTHVNRNANVTYFGPGEDGASGARRLYGDNNAFDLGASIFAFSGVNGEYSTHAVKPWIGHRGSCGSRDGVACFRVNAGDRVQVPFTLENNGARTESVTYKFYVSGNNNITDSDQEIATITGATLAPDQPREETFALTIPRGLRSGTNWYLGVIVDRREGLLPPGSATEEVTRKNNAAWYPFSVINGNERPSASSTPATAATTIGTSVAIVIPSGSDPNSDTLTYSVSSSPANGRISRISGRTMTYQPNPGFVGEDRFQVRVTDPYGLASTTTTPATVRVEDAYEQNDTRASAFDLRGTPGRWLNTIAGLGAQFDDDWYRIFAPTGAEQLTIVLLFTHALGDIDLALVDDSGNTLTTSTGTVDNESIPRFVVPDGNRSYFIRVYYKDRGTPYNLLWRFAPPDADGDGSPDVDDNCPNDANPRQDDHDGDDLGDVCDPDDDQDGRDDLVDAFPFDANEQDDTDADGIGNNADPDDDNDGVPDDLPDNCPLIANPGQTDSDDDGIGDDCDDRNLCERCLPSMGGWRAIIP